MVVDHTPWITDWPVGSKLHLDRVFTRGGLQPPAEALIKVYQHIMLKPIITRVKNVLVIFLKPHDISLR